MTGHEVMDRQIRNARTGEPIELPGRRTDELRATAFVGQPPFT
jgi:hypothetical protein